jgi:hypothetical protein
MPVMALDTPADGFGGPQPFVVAGWAVDRAAPSGTGVDAIHVWAFPVGGGSPVPLGAAAYGGARVDVSAVFGSQFLNSGYTLNVNGLVQGTYDLGVYLHSTVTGTFSLSIARRVTMQ